MIKTTVHSLLYALTHTVSNLILYVDSDDITYNENIKVTLEDGKLMVRSSSETLTKAKL